MSISLHNFMELESEKYVQVETQPHHMAGLFANLLDTLGRSDCGWEHIYSCYYDCEEDGTSTFYEGEVAEAGKPGVWTYKVSECEPGQEEVVTNPEIDGVKLTVQLKRMVTEIIATTDITLLAQRKPESKDIAWREIFQNPLVEKQRLTLNTYPLTTDDGVELTLDDVDMPLALAEKLKTEKHLLMIGEPGAGTTTLLQKIAHWVATQTEQDVVIWVSLADLQGRNLEEYLLQKWLKDALILPVLPEIEEAFISLFNRKRVWLLLDGVHEMAATGNPLATVAAQIRGWVAQARVVMTCRQSIWNVGKNALPKFDVYRYLGFENSEEVGKFIQCWFAHQPELGKQLLAALAKDKKGQAWDIVRNPFRLTLLCRAWELHQGDLPKTKAALYGQFVEALYELKQEEFPTTSQQQQELNAALGRLAVRGMEQLESPFQFKEDVVREILGREKKAFYQLAMQLGWLKIVDVAVENPDESVYAFAHAIFQEYFAALVVNDWGYFLPVNFSDEDGKVDPPLIPPYEGGKVKSSLAFSDEEGKEETSAVEGDLEEAYRVFQPQWKEVILLWFGREDVQKEKKEAFVERLVNFEDGCGDWNLNYPRITKGFYEYRAYFLTGAIFREFQDSCLANKVVEQIVKWCMSSVTTPTYIQELIESVLIETDSKRALNYLMLLLDKKSSESTVAHVVKLSGEIVGGNESYINYLVQLLNKIDSKSTLISFIELLGKIAVGNKLAINFLIKLIDGTDDKNIRQGVIETLGEIAIGSKPAIDHLIQFLDKTDDEDRLNSFVELLKKIAVENKPAINRLIQLLDESDNEDIRRNVIGILEKIAIGSKPAINRLIQLLDETDDEDTRMSVISSLSNAVGNEAAIECLIELLVETDDEDLRQEIVESLGKIAVENEAAIERLIELLDETDEDISTSIADALSYIAVGNEAAIERLIQLLDETDEYDRLFIAQYLSMIALENEEAIDRLIELLNETDDYDTCWMIAHNLSNSSAIIEAATDRLTELFNEADNQEVRWNVIESLKKTPEGNEQAISCLIQLLDETNDCDNRIKIIQNLADIAIENEEAIERLIQIFDETDDENIRQQVIESLTKIGIGNDAAIEHFIRLFDETDDEDARIIAAENLAKVAVWNEEAIERLIQWFEENDDDYKYCGSVIDALVNSAVKNGNAIRNLVQIFSARTDNVTSDICCVIASNFAELTIGNRDVIQYLITMFDYTYETYDDGGPIWIAEILSYIARGEEQIIDRLIELLDFFKEHNDKYLIVESNLVNNLAYTAVRAIGNEDVIDRLIQMLEDFDDPRWSWFNELGGRENVVGTLSKIAIANKAAINRLIQLLDKTDYEDTRRSVVEIVGNIAAGHEGAIARFIQLVDEASEHDTLKLVIESLGKIAAGHEGAIARLVQLLDESPKQDILESVIESLGKMAAGHEGASDRLIQLFTETTDESIRTKIVNSLSKIMATQQQYYKVVLALKDNFTNQIYKNKFDLYQKSYQLVWQCAHHLPYSEFCKAW